VLDDVLVLGGGPAGRALAAATAERGLRTVLVDPAPDRPWRATYASWAEALPPDLPPGIVAERVPGRVVALRDRRLDWEYAVLDVAALRAHLDDRMAAAGVGVRRGRAVGSPCPGAVALADGMQVRARVVVDAAGARQPLSRPPRARWANAQQTAYGVIVDEATAMPLVAPGEALFMDWRPDHGEPGWPTFLYGVPLGGGAVLLEETSLARRPGLPLPVLHRRLCARLARHGVVPAPDAAVEKVRFPVDSARHRARGVVGFGAAAPLVHPATGFSVAESLRLAPLVANALAEQLPRGPAHAVAAASSVLWPLSARIVHVLRRRGLEALLRMPPARVPAFFEAFFDLPARHRWAYLTGRVDLAGMVAAMNALYLGADWGLRMRLIGPALCPPLRRNGPPAEALRKGLDAT
jgi:lycopene beta-cyclase